MSIVSELLTIIDDVKTLANEHLKKGAEEVLTYDDENTQKYFKRPIASVAREAKRSIIEFPLIVSEGISSDIAVALAKTNQTTAAEYIRLMISNQDLIDVRNAEDLSKVKNTVLSKMRGGSLEETVIINRELTESVSRYVKRNINSLVEEVQEVVEQPEPLYEATLTNFDHLTSEIITENPTFRTPMQLYNGATDPKDPNLLRDIAIIDKYTKELYDYVQAGDIQGINNMFRNTPRELEIMFNLQPGEPWLDRVIEFERSNAYRNVNHENGYARKIVHGIIKPEAKKAGILGTGLEIGQLQPMLIQTVLNKQMRKDAKKNGRNANADIAAIKKQLDALTKTLGGGQAGKNRAAMEILAIKAQSMNTVNAKESMAKYMKDITVQPTILDLGIHLALDPANVVKTNITMGVSSKVHRIPSQDVVINIGESFNRGSLIFNFLRVTSGEISFLKDFVLSLDDIRERHTAKSEGTKLFNKLRRQVEWNKQAQNVVSRAINERHFVPPTATLAVSVDEVYKIKDLYNIDLYNPSNIRRFMNMTNMMGFIIVDESLGSLAYFEDGDNDYNIVAVSEIVRQSGKDNSVKDILSIMAKR